jgi:hypothetical protein
MPRCGCALTRRQWRGPVGGRGRRRRRGWAGPPRSGPPQAASRACRRRHGGGHTGTGAAMIPAGGGRVWLDIKQSVCIAPLTARSNRASVAAAAQGLQRARRRRRGGGALQRRRRARRSLVRRPLARGGPRARLSGLRPSPHPRHLSPGPHPARAPSPAAAAAAAGSPAGPAASSSATAAAVQPNDPPPLRIGLSPVRAVPCSQGPQAPTPIQKVEFKPNSNPNPQSSTRLPLVGPDLESPGPPACHCTRLGRRGGTGSLSAGREQPRCMPVAVAAAG